MANANNTNKRKAPGGVARLVEDRLEGPVFLAVGAMMVIRSAQVFSGGALIMAAFLGPVGFRWFSVITGVGLGLGSEMLATIAGRSWRGWRREVHDINARTGLQKLQRQALRAQAEENANISRFFMVVGCAASLYTGVTYLFTNSATVGGFSWGLAASDLITCAVITAVVLYIGVFREKRGQDRAAEVIEEIDDGVNAAVMAAIERFKVGASTDRDTRLIAEHLTGPKQQKFLRAVAKENAGRTWTAKQLRESLGYGNDQTKVRGLNRRINTLANEPENGVRKAPDGRTWLVPHWLVMQEWGEEMASYAALSKIGSGRATDTPRHLDGGSAMDSSGLPSVQPDTRPSVSQLALVVEEAPGGEASATA